jgi:hypothetical protein
MIHFCTLFDHGYLGRGMALYNSLKKNCKTRFVLHILCMDQVTYDILNNLNYIELQLLQLKDIENNFPGLLNAKANRNKREYSWTLASVSQHYLLKRIKAPHLTYLDADLCFYQDPQILIDEMGEHDVFITKHNYDEKYDEAENSGIFCVQFVTFKNNNNGKSILKEWAYQCIDWCYEHIEDAKFGDQKYLDIWPEKYHNIKVSEHLGAGVAPWNLRKYEIDENLNIKYQENQYPIIFYHFHHFTFEYYYYYFLKFKIFSRRTISNSRYNFYDISAIAADKIYAPYMKLLLEIEVTVNKDFPNKIINSGPTNKLNLIKQLKTKFNGKNN